MDRRRFLAAGGMATALLGGFPARLLAADPAVTGSWTAPFNLGLVSIHAILLHTGNVVLFSWPNDTVGSDAVLWNPATGRTTNIALTYQRDIFCSGTTVLSDGRVFIAGGHIWQGVLNPTQGVINTTIFDPASSAWTEGPMMSQARWYPTTTLLGNGTVIICGGTINTGTNAINVDRYNPASNTINRLPAAAGRAMVTYPRVKLTTGGLLAWTNSATTYYLNPATATWTTGPEQKSGSGCVTDMSVLLPGLTEILQAGGTTPAGVTSTAELLNLSASQPAWAYTSAMHFARVWANSVLLPDGTVLVAGGGAASYYDGPVLTPGDLPPGHPDLDRDGGADGAADVPLHRAAAAGRPGAVRRAELGQVREHRRDLLPALPVQGRAAGDHRCPGHPQLPGGVRRHQPRGGQHRPAGADQAGRGHPLLQLRPALRPMLVHGQRQHAERGAGSVWVASTAAGTLTRVNPGRETVTATVLVGERPYAVAASPQAIWVAVLGRPVMMHVPAHASASSTISWLLRMCG